MMHVYEDVNHWDTQIIYNSLNVLEINQKTLYDLYIQLTVQYNQYASIYMHSDKLLVILIKLKNNTHTNPYFDLTLVALMVATIHIT